MTLERANQKLKKQTRSVALPGARASQTAKEPAEIARELRAKSELGRREARVAAVEKKLG